MDHGGPMKSLFFFIAFSVSFSAFADKTLTSSVYDIDYGNTGDEALVLLNSGEVLKVSEDGSKLMNLPTLHSLLTTIDTSS